MLQHYASQTGWQYEVRPGWAGLGVVGGLSASIGVPFRPQNPQALRNPHRNHARARLVYTHSCGTCCCPAQVEFERQHVGSSFGSPPPPSAVAAAGDGSSSAAAAGACVAYVATVQLSCSDVDTVIATPGKVRVASTCMASVRVRARACVRAHVPDLT